MKTMKLTAGLTLTVTGVLLIANALFGQSTNGPTPVQLQPFAIITGGPDTPVPLDDPQPVHSSVIIAGGTPQTTVVPNAFTQAPTLVHVAVPTATAATPSLLTAVVNSEAPRTVVSPAVVVSIPPQPLPQPQNHYIIVRPGPPKYFPHH